MRGIISASVYFHIFICCVVCQDSSNKYERILKGEGGVQCQDTYALVDVVSQTNKVTNQSAISAVAEAFTRYIKDIQGDGQQQTIIADQYNIGGESTGAAVIGTAQSEPVVIDAVAAGSELILDVVAEAVASVKIDINSPNEGCWAIGFGRAEAVAIAEAVITAVAQAFAAADTTDTLASTKLVAENVEKDLQVAVESIAIHLAAGDGQGAQSKDASVTARTKATAINCALAKAFSAISEDGEQVIGFAQAGCVQALPAMAQRFVQPMFLEPPKVTCGCQENGEYGAPNFCGPWGDRTNGDTICYVDRTNGPCACALPSINYPGATWRYCGNTQAEMQKWLSIDEASFFGDGLGYCPDWKTSQDKIVFPEPPSPPPPSPSPPPPSPPPPPPAQDIVKPLKECPRFKCFADTRECCQVGGDFCKTRFGREFRSEGECGDMGAKVWTRVDTRVRSNTSLFQCYCP